MILTTIAIIAQVTPGAASTPAASATMDPQIVAATAAAKQWFSALAQGKIVPGAALTDEMKAKLTPDVLALLAKSLKDTGDPKTFVMTSAQEAQGFDIFVFHVTFEKAPAVNFLYAVDAAGKVGGLRVAPAP